jgi:RimJ/RimL family protein N-acetyltransferase
MVPVLETERLILRGHKLADFPAHVAMWTDARTLQHTHSLARSEEELWTRLLRNQGQWQLMGSGMWALEDKASGAYAGMVGFIYAKRMIAIPYRDQPEMGWVIAPDFHAKGFAVEAVAKILAWGDAHLEAAESWCMINPLNLVSRKVAARVGFREAGRAQYQDVEMLTFLRPRGRL